MRKPHALAIETLIAANLQGTINNRPAVAHIDVAGSFDTMVRGGDRAEILWYANKQSKYDGGRIVRVSMPPSGPKESFVYFAGTLVEYTNSAVIVGYDGKQPPKDASA